jgi:hypothetical protein
MLNGGKSPTTGQSILRRETVSMMLENQIPSLPDFGRQGFPGHPILSNPIPDLYYQEGNPKQGWSFAGMLTPESDSSTGRSGKTVFWAGIANTYWWMDFEAGVGGMIASQVVPFYGKSKGSSSLKSFVSKG